MTRLRNSENNGGRTVLVGVKMDSQSKELLTWALVKVAQPGDRVIALHALTSTGEVRTKGKSSVLCLLNTLDTVLSVYEGFCNLKQIDLKIKLSQGASVRKTIVQEAKTFGALTVIVGVSKTTTFGSSVSIARYCASQLPRTCSVLAASNGKVMFQREALSVDQDSGAVTESHRPRIFGVIHHTLRKNSKVLNSSSEDTSTSEGSGRNSECETFSDSGDSPQQLAKISAVRRDLSAGADRGTIKNDQRASLGCKIQQDSGLDAKNDNHLFALVPVRNTEVVPSSISLVTKEMPRPGCPLLRRDFSPSSGDLEAKQTSVVQWAMQLPRRYTAALYSDRKARNNYATATKAGCTKQNQQLVQFVSENDEIRKGKYAHLPKELKILCERHASTCRLFTYEELAQATCHFSSDNLVGKGGSSRVYKGRLSDGKELAVKILKSSDGAWEEFLLEIEITTTLKHKNIISLIGFCFTGTKCLLVYDFASKGNLEENLHGQIHYNRASYIYH